MIITKKHALLIARMIEKWEGGLPLDRALDELSDEDIEYLLHLDLAGLVEEEDGSYELTQAGHLIAEAIRECIETTGRAEDWDENFRLIGSEVISMIEISRAAQSETIAQKEISGELERRGLMKEGRLLPVAESVLQAYDIASPRIFITPGLAEKLRKTPPGPGKKSLLPLTREEIYQLESMRLLTFSIPVGNTYSLTGAGQQIRAGLLKGAAVNFPLNDELLFSLLEESWDDELKEKLMALGAINDKEELLPAGVHFRKAAELLYESPITTNPSVDLDSQDLMVLEIIDNLWKKNKLSPEIYPSYKQIRKEVEGSKTPTTPWKTSYTLYLLESFRMITSEKSEKGELVYRLTEWGERVLKDRLQHNHSPVFSTAVMAITTTRMENLSPDDRWFEEAERQDLIGNGFPSKSGRLFAELASSIDRYPLISAFEAKVLKALPLWRGMFESRILSLFPENQREEVLLALRKLVAQALVDAIPGGLYKVTEAGERFKRAIAAVPDGIEFHVTPHVIRLLLAAEEATDEKGKINWKQAERISLFDPDIFQKTLTQAIKSHFIKGDKITSAGFLLLEGVKILEEVKTFWEEIEI